MKDLTAGVYSVKRLCTGNKKMRFGFTFNTDLPDACSKKNGEV